MLRIYSPSGSIGDKTVLAPIPIAVAGVILGFVYQSALHYLPFALLHFFLAVGMLIGTGMITTTALRWGQCRNTPIAWLMGVFAAIVVLSTSYATEYWLSVKGLANAPHFADFLGERMMSGWRGSKFEMTGPLALWVWGLEASMGLMGGIFGGLGTARTPFCEHCQRFATRRLCRKSVQAPSKQVVERLKGAGNVEDLVCSLPAEPGSGPSDRLTYEMQGCYACDEMAHLRISVTRTTPAKRRSRTSTDTVIRNVMLTPEQAQSAGAFLKQLP